MTDTRSPTLQTLSRGLKLLTLINQRGALSLAELYHATGYSRPAILRMLATLEAEGFVRRWLDDGLYRVNTLSPGNSRNFAWLTVVADTIGPSLRALTDVIGWPVDVAVLDGDKMTVCETTRRQSKYPVDLITSGYQVHILQSAVGRAYVSFAPERERALLIDRLALSTDPFDAPALDSGAVRELVSETRARGYAVRTRGYTARGKDFDGNMQALALPVMQDDNVAACLSVAWTASYKSPEEFAASHLELLRSAAREATDQLRATRDLSHDFAGEPGYVARSGDT